MSDPVSRSYPYEDSEILERARDYSEAVKSDQHPDDDHPAQSRRRDPVPALAALDEVIIRFAVESHGRRSNDVRRRDLMPTATWASPSRLSAPATLVCGCP